MNRTRSNSGLYGSPNSFGFAHHSSSYIAPEEDLYSSDSIPLTRRDQALSHRQHPHDTIYSPFDGTKQHYANSRADYVNQRPLPPTPVPPPPPPPPPRPPPLSSLPGPRGSSGQAPSYMWTPNMTVKPAVPWLKLPWIVWALSSVQAVIFVVELIRMGVLTGSPIQLHPSVNPMIGPSTYLLINMGARFTPCMHKIANVTDSASLTFPCANSTAQDTNVCTLSQLCGMGGLQSPPHQWWRFITPIFLHAGFIHLGFNLLLQVKLGGEIERAIGHVRFFLVYFASGIAGFLLGGNFAPNGIASTGASGSIFGIISLDLLDLLFNWHEYVSPLRNLLLLVAEIVISFVIGLLPGLDNFSHIGGFAMGVLVGVAILRSPSRLRVRSNPVNTRLDDDEFVPATATTYDDFGPRKMRAATFNWRHPISELKHRNPWWYAWCALRVTAVVLVVVYFVELSLQFQSGGSPCSWCKYLSCLPVNGWCNIGNIQSS